MDEREQYEALMKAAEAGRTDGDGPSDEGAQDDDGE